MSKFLTKVLRKLKTPIKSDNMYKNFNKNKPSIYFEENRLEGKPYLMPLCILKTTPCFWLKNAGGCSVCGYQLNTSVNLQFHDEDIINQVNYIIDQIDPEKYPLITVTSSGSFLDSREVPDPLRRKILKMLSDAGFKYFNFECRPEFLLDEEKLEELNEFFPNRASVGIGLESKNDFIRNTCMHKGFKLETYINATKLLQKHDIIYDSYILFGKPFLTEKENIEDVIDTIKFSFKHGASWALLMVANLQPYTLSHWLWKHDLYQLPNLLGVFKILDAFPPEQRDRIIIKGHYKASPHPLKFATACEKCTSRIVEAFNDWDLTGDLYHINRVRNICECKEEYEKELNKSHPPLKERMLKIYNILSNELFNKPFEGEIKGI